MKNNNNNFKELEDKVMSEIKSGRVKLHPKYVFLVKKLGLNSGIILTVILAILFFSLAIFYMRTADSLEYLSFGKAGILAFLESFPYLLVVSLILFLFATGYLITKTEWSYKKPFKYFALVILVFVLVMGSIAAYSGLSENIEEQALKNRVPGMFFRPFIGRGIEPRGRGIAGKIYEINDDYLILETPRGFEKVSLVELRCENSNCQNQFEIDQFIIAIGKREDNIFVADRIRIADEERFPPMIRRGIHHQFGPFFGNHPTATPSLLPHLLNFDGPTNECVKQCFEDRIHPRECFDRCIE
ncbi:hypothetical protein COV56_01225 [Candidatus Kuenenbacteria bacterium CG11_big_fil_rev_8_21_14_0_20_37_9]|nr:MAG: hypothetical protein COV56_01225 [Candidatus Kuenenbacteria bacterium CG11_big_fil_rev_8_21_14_0_20_37_9]